MNFLIKIFLNAISVVIVAYILTGVHVHDFWNALLLAFVLSLLNASVKPVLIFLTIPATIFSLGLFLLVINAVIIEIAAWILAPGFTVDSFWWALGFSILLSIVNGFFERMTIKPASPERDDSVKVYDKDGNRIA